MSNYVIQITAKGLRRFFSYLAVIAGIIALFMIFAPALTLNGSEISYSGLDVCFGYYYGGYHTTASVNILTYIAIIIGIVFIILAQCDKLGYISYIIAIVAFLYAAVGFILTDLFTNYGQAYHDMIYEITRSGYVYITLGGGAITGLITSLIALVSVIASLIVAKRNFLIKR